MCVCVCVCGVCGGGYVWSVSVVCVCSVVSANFKQGRVKVMIQTQSSLTVHFLPLNSVLFRDSKNHQQV